MQQGRGFRKIYVNPIFKDKATVLKTLADTEGVYTLGELVVYPGGNNFLHTHNNFEETFIGVEGSIGVRIRNEEFLLGPGQSMTIPRKTPHYFFNRSDKPVTCYVRMDPGQDDFIKGIAILYGLAADQKTDSKGKPKSLTDLAMISILMDTKPSGALGWLYPLFRWLAASGRKNGREKEHLEKYYFEPS